MNEVIKLIMQRDNIGYDEAFQLVNECVREIHEVLEESRSLPPYNLYYTVTDIIKDTLGLEPDYLEMLL